MNIDGEGKRIRVYLGESDRLGKTTLYEAIVREARNSGIAGATVLRGMMGYGANSRIHTAKILRLSDDLPILVEIVDRTDRIDAFLPKLDAMLRDGLVTVEPIHIHTYRHSNTD